MTNSFPTPQPDFVQRLRDALVRVLAEGTWKDIKTDFIKVGLEWKEEFEPGHGKPRYLNKVLYSVDDDKVIDVAQRVINRLKDHDVIDVENELFWIAAGGKKEISDLTRTRIAQAFDGTKLHPNKSPTEVLSKFVNKSFESTLNCFEYNSKGYLIKSGFLISPVLDEPRTRSIEINVSHLDLLNECRFSDWPDARLFKFLESLIDPLVRCGAEQEKMVSCLNSIIVMDCFKLERSGMLSGHPKFEVRSLIASGVKGRPKNIIFASKGPKPEIGFSDAVNNDIVILNNEDSCLTYDVPTGNDGLRWKDLVDWWITREGLQLNREKARNQLGGRLQESLTSPPERLFFDSYFKSMHPKMKDSLPALIPQVYLHYDPRTIYELRKRGEEGLFDIQRMDFLLLLPRDVRVVIEIDGQQHYSTGIEQTAKPSPKEYAKTVRSDRSLRLFGYEVYRFGGYELRSTQESDGLVSDFFTRLFQRHGLM